MGQRSVAVRDMYVLVDDGAQSEWIVLQRLTGDHEPRLHTYRSRQFVCRPEVVLDKWNRFENVGPNFSYTLCI